MVCHTRAKKKHTRSTSILLGGSNCEKLACFLIAEISDQIVGQIRSDQIRSFHQANEAPLHGCAGRMQHTGHISPNIAARHMRYLCVHGRMLLGHDAIRTHMHNTRATARTSLLANKTMLRACKSGRWLPLAWATPSHCLGQHDTHTICHKHAMRRAHVNLCPGSQTMRATVCVGGGGLYLLLLWALRRASILYVCSCSQARVAQWCLWGRLYAPYTYTKEGLVG